MSRLNKFHTKGLIEAGCDEAGRGCLAGPVVAAAVIFPNEYRLIRSLNDSKVLTREQREHMASKIRELALSYAIVEVDNQEIDRINILQASVKAMNLAVERLAIRPDMLLIDGHYFHTLSGIRYQCVVGGDGKFASIAAASILAKVHRDKLMEGHHHMYPHYDWMRNKGYGTPRHRQAIEKNGITPLHRRTFARDWLDKQLGLEL